jgi:hypothetical protein
MPVGNDVMNLSDWLAHATADAEARGLPELKPLLETLGRSTQALRDADGEFGHPAAQHGTHNAAADPVEHAKHAERPGSHDEDAG